MSDEATPASGFFTELQLAFSFLTILPVIDTRPASEDTVAASFTWFPIVGPISQPSPAHAIVMRPSVTKGSRGT